MISEGRMPPRRKESPRKVAPGMETLLPQESPLATQQREGEYTGDIEHDDGIEVKAVKNLLKSLDAEASRTMGNGYWTALVFPDAVTLQSLLAVMDWTKHTEGRMAYTDGLAVVKDLVELLRSPKAVREDIAARLEEVLEVPPIRFKSRRADKTLVSLVGVYESDEGGERLSQEVSYGQGDR